MGHVASIGPTNGEIRNAYRTLEENLKGNRLKWEDNINMDI
jgi:hypothetical protein